jgi:hypothetical protein
MLKGDADVDMPRLRRLALGAQFVECHFPVFFGTVVNINPPDANAGSMGGEQLHQV